MLAALALVAIAASACSPAQHPRDPNAARRGPECPAAVLPLLPRDATSWLFARPRAIYEHPRLGPIVAHSFDDASEVALSRRAERTGYDVRTLDRAAIGWTPRGVAHLALGPLDTARLTARFWETLLNPRRRARDPRANERLEGLVDGHLEALLVVPSCGLAAHADRGATRAVDRALVLNDARDPPELLVWRTSQVPDPVARAANNSALVYSIRALEVRVREQPGEGLHVALTLAGPLPDDAEARVRRALAALTESPLGELAGAVQWLTPERVAFERTAESLRMAVVIPWRALSAIADAMRGEVGNPAVR